MTVWNLFPSTESSVLVTWGTLTLLMNESSSGSALQVRHWRVEERRWWAPPQQNWAWKRKYDIALARLFFSQWRSCTFICLYRKVLPNSLEETSVHTASSKGGVCLSKCQFGGRNAAGRSFPFNTHQIILQAFWKTEAMLLSVACSVAATNSPGSWQQVMLGNVTYWLSILNVDPKRMAMLQAQTRYCSGSPWGLFSTVLSPASGYHLTELIIVFVSWQTRPELWSSHSRLRPPLFPGLREQFLCTQVNKSGILISQPLKDHLLGAVVLFSTERFSSQAFSYSKFDLKYPGVHVPHQCESPLQNPFSSLRAQGLTHMVAKIPHPPHLLH